MDIKWKWIAILFPIGLSLAAAALLEGGRLENPTLRLRADLGTLAALIGLGLSASLVALWMLRDRAKQIQRQGFLQAQAQAAEERLRFLRRLDHELKNPLAAIRIGLVNLAENANQSQEKILGSVGTQTLRLSQLTTDLRKLAELETRPLERASVNLADLVQEVVEQAREEHEMDGRRVTLTLPQAPWPLPAVSGDWDLLSLAVHNLLDNALKFTRPGDTIEVRAFEDGATVVLEVADTGPGIPEAEIPHVWEELYRGEGARGIPGSGMGLATVRVIVERHGGRVLLRSRVGQGTVITVRLPVG
jgi:two-component system OmpR family sensor kinase